MEAPRELLERLGGQELSLGALHVVEHEEERLAAQLAQQLRRVVAWQRRLRIVRWRIYTYPRQVAPFIIIIISSLIISFCFSNKCLSLLFMLFVVFISFYFLFEI